MCDRGRGWIKLYRDIQEHWIWQDAQYFKWWIDLLLMVNHSPKTILIDRKPVQINQGMRWTSISYLANRWEVNRKTVNKFLELLEAENMVEVKSYYNGTTIKVLNYAKYQCFEEENGQPNAQPNTQPTGKATGKPTGKRRDNGLDTNKNDKNDIKNDKNDKNDKKQSARDFAKDKPAELRPVLDEFIKFRERAKKPLTAYALKLAYNRAKKLSGGNIEVMEAIFNQSIVNGWTGIYELKDKSIVKSSGNIREQYKMTQAQDLYLTGVEGGTDPDEIRETILDIYGEEGLNEVRDYIKQHGQVS